MGRRRSDENLREAILDAAERLLAGGPHAVTSRSVQRAAGVSSGTFFHYFPTVDELLLTLASRAAEQQPARFGRPADDGLGPVLGRLFDPNRRDTVLPWLRQRAVDAPALQDALRRYDAAVSERFVAQVRAALGDAGEQLDVEATVEVVRALAEGFQLRVSSGTSSVDPERLSRAAIALVARAAIGTTSS